MYVFRKLPLLKYQCSVFGVLGTDQPARNIYSALYLYSPCIHTRIVMSVYRGTSRISVMICVSDDFNRYYILASDVF
jgi:hypothetical protein